MKSLSLLLISAPSRLTVSLKVFRVSASALKQVLFLGIGEGGLIFLSLFLLNRMLFAYVIRCPLG